MERTNKFPGFDFTTRIIDMKINLYARYTHVEIDFLVCHKCGRDCLSNNPINKWWLIRRDGEFNVVRCSRTHNKSVVVFKISRNSKNKKKFEMD